jgi:alpha-glucosidase
MKYFVLFCFLIYASVTQGNNPTFPIEVNSPDEKISFTLFSSDGESYSLSYTLDYNGKIIVKKSALGIICNQKNWGEQLILDEVSKSNTDTTWHPVYGERNSVRDNYNEVVFTFNKENRKRRKLQLIVRAYNEGIAFRYYFPESVRGGTYLHITEESTEFTFPKQTMAWFTPSPQGLYDLLPMKDWSAESERPLTLELQNGLFASLTEAQMVNYSRTKLKLHDTKPNTVVCSMYGDVDEIGPFGTPWRVIMIAEEPGELLENNDLILNLNPPCAIENTSWIKPGKVMREHSLSTEGAKKLVDFAVERNLQYIHFDAGWYGHEYHAASNATTVTVDPRRNPKGDLNLQEAIQYAKSKGIGVFLYINQRALAAQLDTLLPLLKSWGVSGIKFGFVHVGSHRWTTWLHDAVKKCAEYELMVDIHDNYRPTGFSRTYPNLMTQEGIRGNEEMPDATHNTVLPFTRFIAGAADYTFCYYTREEFGHPDRHVLNTPAHQLALPVIYYSPLQWLYWYDNPEDYQGEPELEFWDVLPTTWDETKVLQGEIGKYITVARRNGDSWFIGTITNTEGRELRVSLDLLDINKKYEARIYSDDPTVNTRTKVGIKRMQVDFSDTLELQLPPSGGCAIHLDPLQKK